MFDFEQEIISSTKVESTKLKNLKTINEDDEDDESEDKCYSSDNDQVQDANGSNMKLEEISRPIVQNALLALSDADDSIKINFDKCVKSAVN